LKNLIHIKFLIVYFSIVQLSGVIVERSSSVKSHRKTFFKKRKVRSLGLLSKYHHFIAFSLGTTQQQN